LHGRPLFRSTLGLPCLGSIGALRRHRLLGLYLAPAQHGEQNTNMKELASKHAAKNHIRDPKHPCGIPPGLSCVAQFVQQKRNPGEPGGLKTALKNRGIVLESSPPGVGTPFLPKSCPTGQSLE
jgi:hypothetical protein